MAAAAGSTEAAREAVERVLRSEALRGSEGLRQMLAYLAEKSLSAPAVELKEYTVGVEACGKPESYDPQRDASVRVQAGRLRKRLQEYYAAEGAADKVVLEVPKGRFEVQFHARDSEQGRQVLSLPEGTAHVLTPARAWAAACALLAAGSLLWALSLRRQMGEWDARYGIAERERAAAGAPEFWRPFLDRNIPTLAVIGSPAFYAGRDQQLWVRVPEPGDEQPDGGRAALDALRAKLGLLEGPRYDFAAMGDTLAVQKLTAYLAAAGVRLKTVAAHQATWEAAAEGNLILLGDWQTNPLLRRLPVNRDFDLREDGLAHNRNPKPGEPLAYTPPSGQGQSAFAVAATYAGLKPGREILAIQAQNPGAAAGVLESLMDPQSAQSLFRRAGAPAQGRHFQMLLRVWLDRGSAVKTEFVTCHVER